jgi:hypothetical protein
VKEGLYCHFHRNKEKQRESINLDETVQCKGITRKGIRCKREICGEDYCYQHKNQESDKSTKENSDKVHHGKGITKEGKTCSKSVVGAEFCQFHIDQKILLSNDEKKISCKLQLIPKYDDLEVHIKGRKLNNPSIEKKMLKKLQSPTGKEDGDIYIYEKKAKRGEYKIGCTQIGVENRLRQWTLQCGFEIIHRYTSESPIPFCEACERLIHLELKARGMKMKEKECKGCGKTHNEWFKGEFAVIQEVVKYWVKTIRILYGLQH